jgi:hypothetical protein
MVQICLALFYSSIGVSVNAPSRITLEQLKEDPGGVWLFKKRDRNYLHEGFASPSNRIELYSERLALWGLHPLPG